MLVLKLLLPIMVPLQQVLDRDLHLFYVVPAAAHAACSAYGPIQLPMPILPVLMLLMLLFGQRSKLLATYLLYLKSLALEMEAMLLGKMVRM